MALSDAIVKALRSTKLHFSLIDPDKQAPDAAGSIAAVAKDAGSFAIMVGGSTISSQDQVNSTVQAIKKRCDLPVILFPSGAKFLSPYADAVFFMSLLNSRRLEYVIREHVVGAPFIKKVGLEPISMGYVIVEPGMTAGRVGDVDLISRTDTKTAVGYALAAEYLGMHFFYLEAGSGATSPVPNDLIRAVRKETTIPLIVGGGIKDATMAKEKATAGADIIVTGSALEASADFKQRLPQIVNAVSEA